MTHEITSWQAWAVGAAVFAALTAILAKIGVQSINPDLATFVRTAVVLVLLGGILMWQGPRAVTGPWTWRTMLLLVLSGLATGASWICYFRALKTGPVTRVAPIDKLSVVLVALIGAICLGEKLGAMQWLGVVLVTVGIMLVSMR